MQEDKRGLLLIDNFRGHDYIDFRKELEEMKYNLEFLPPNSTQDL